MRQWLSVRRLPRTIAQADAMKDAGINVDYVLEIDVLTRRSSSAWMAAAAPGSGRVYHVKFNPPKVDGVDDITGEPLIRATTTRRNRQEASGRVPQPDQGLLNYYNDWASPACQARRNTPHRRRRPVEQIRDSAFAALANKQCLKSGPQCPLFFARASGGRVSFSWFSFLQVVFSWLRVPTGAVCSCCNDVG